MLWLVGGPCLSFVFVCVRVYVLRFLRLFTTATMYDLLRCFGLSHDLFLLMIVSVLRQIRKRFMDPSVSLAD
jgi:hypothetical protein